MEHSIDMEHGIMVIAYCTDVLIMRLSSRDYTYNNAQNRVHEYECFSLMILD